jgi:SanA protein
MKKKLLISTLALLTICCISLYVCNKKISANAEGRLYSRVEAIPYNKVALLLGTARQLKHGAMNPYYRNRIEATLQLVAAKKITYVIISGDNGHVEYNEPEMMRADLIKGGMDSTHVFLDYAGFRTYDSMVRLKEIFSQTKVTVISQQFHNERALYIASRTGIDAIGFNAKDVNQKMGLRTQIRERFARVKVFVDFLFGIDPKFLGDKVPIPA